MPFTDSHCHLDFSEFSSHLPELLIDCKKNNIDKIIIPAISPTNWLKVITLCQSTNNAFDNNLPQLYACTGIHPWFLHDLTQSALITLRDAVERHKHDICAIGETGIDLPIATEKNNLAQQILFFDFQLDLAQQHNLPIIVHHRRSHTEVLARIKRVKPDSAGIIHAFSGSYQQACQYIDLGFKIGVGGSITYPRAEKTIKAIKRLPLESLVLETDAPAMPLHGFQGQNNSPLQLIRVFQSLCLIRPENTETIAEQIEKNLSQLFNW